MNHRIPDEHIWSNTDSREHALFRAGLTTNAVPRQSMNRWVHRYAFSRGDRNRMRRGMSPRCIRGLSTGMPTRPPYTETAEKLWTPEVNPTVLSVIAYRAQ